MSKICITGFVPDGTGNTVVACCLVDVDLQWIPMNNGDNPLQGVNPAVVTELNFCEDIDGNNMRQVTAAIKGHVPDYYAWARKVKGRTI